VNPTYIGGTGTGVARPAFNFNPSGFLAQGISSGAELRW